ncbi:hypothetical protein L873DRAFT_858770 [Choiromyces venosus 120613-1]|uniref:Uncharacterized protein n=1 Tax=Choiromyces venosus 120613-1 TaxID=1336337 RepID=A0A3N4ISI6_9PEZI|nr:hypothetical protein L873DRAFT_858770 [Choiromyces venosus 120613-1]
MGKQLLYHLTIMQPYSLSVIPPGSCPSPKLLPSLTVFLIGCHSCWLLFLLAAILAGCHSHRLPFSFADILVGCFSCWLLLLLAAFLVSCHSHWLLFSSVALLVSWLSCLVSTSSISVFTYYLIGSLILNNFILVIFYY